MFEELCKTQSNCPATPSTELDGPRAQVDSPNSPEPQQEPDPAARIEYDRMSGPDVAWLALGFVRVSVWLGIWNRVFGLKKKVFRKFNM